MHKGNLDRIGEFEWQLAPRGAMRVPAVIFGDAALVAAMEDKVFEQAANVASLPGIVKASYAMPDAHWGYGFPIGGVAGFDPDQGGVVSAGGVGFDIACGVRTLTTGLRAGEVERVKERLADALFERVPAGVGSTGAITLDDAAMSAMLAGGAAWAIAEGWGEGGDRARIEEGGCMAGAVPEAVSAAARERQRREMGTLGSGNHYLEVQRIERIFDAAAAAAFGLVEGEALVSIHCGSRGLGHQIGTEFLTEMADQAAGFGIHLPEKELACAPILSPLGERYLGAMRAGINCALANRQILTHLSRQVFADLLPRGELRLLYDVSHNTCKLEEHPVDGVRRRLFVHRKGATRAYGPGHPDLPADLAEVGQPVLIGGSMGTASYILAGISGSSEKAFASACHGAGRALSRHQAAKTWGGRKVQDDLKVRGVLVRSPSLRGLAEEAPGAYKDVDAVVEAAHQAGLARKVARLTPILCVKG